MHNKIRYLTGAAMVGLAGTLPLTAFADATQHYVPGVEGTKGSTVPPPGLYLRTYGVYYHSNDIKVDAISRDDGKLPGDNVAVVEAVVPRLVWISDKKLLGADYGMELIAPIMHKDIKAAGQSTRHSGLGDVYFGPLVLGWHEQRYDAVFAAGFWTDAFSNHEFDPSSVGQGYSNIMLTLGGTWYLTPDRSWAFSLLNRYETQASEIEDTDVTPGDNWVAEWGISHDINQALTLGLVGMTVGSSRKMMPREGFPRPRMRLMPSAARSTTVRSLWA